MSAGESTAADRGRAEAKAQGLPETVEDQDAIQTIARQFAAARTTPATPSVRGNAGVVRGPAKPSTATSSPHDCTADNQPTHPDPLRMAGG